MYENNIQKTHQFEVFLKKLERLTGWCQIGTGSFHLYPRFIEAILERF